MTDLESRPAPAWRVRWVAFGHFNSREVFTSPDGVEYVRAGVGSSYDLEVPSRTPGLQSLRLRRRDASIKHLRRSLQESEGSK